MILMPRLGYRTRPAVLLVDALVGMAIFSVVVTGVMYLLLFTQEGIVRSGDRFRATYLSQRAMEGVRAIRDDKFERLVDGTYGVVLSSTGAWILAGTGSVSSDGYTTSVTITQLASDRKQITAHTTWTFGIHRTGTSTLLSEVTDWRTIQAIGDWSSVSLEGSFIDAGTPLFNRAAVGSSYAYITSETSAGGDGLYVFDVTNLAAPTRVSSSFTLGYAGHAVLISGNYLYVVTEDPSQEVRIYNISNPLNLSGGALTASINIPGSAKARDIGIINNYLFVSSQEDSTESELFSYDISNLSSITQLDDFNDPSSSFDSISLHNGYAYLSSYLDTMELRVVDAFDPNDLVLATGEGYNLTDTNNGLTVFAFSGFLLEGRAVGGVSDELHLFDIYTNPVPDSAPKNHEVGAAVNEVDADPTAVWGFAATENTGKELIVIDVSQFNDGGSAESTFYDTATGNGRGVTYDIIHDRVFLMTNTAVLIIQPS